MHRVSSFVTGLLASALLPAVGCKPAAQAPVETAAVIDTQVTGAAMVVNQPLGLFFSSVAAAAPASGVLNTATYEVDPDHAGAVFAVSHLGTSVTYGRFNNISGKFHVDADWPDKSTFEILIKADSIDTGNAKRDEHLRNADFFNAGQFPTITFKSTKVALENGQYMVTGDLNMHGVARQITIPLRKLNEGLDPWDNYCTGFAGQLTLKRSDFGMDKLLETVGDDIAVMVSFEGRRK